MTDWITLRFVSFSTLFRSVLNDSPLDDQHPQFSFLNVRLICDFCPSDQRFAYSFFQIPSRDGHPCCSAIHFPLSGRVRDFHPLERAHGAQTKKESPLPSSRKQALRIFYASGSALTFNSKFITSILIFALHFGQ